VIGTDYSDWEWAIEHTTLLHGQLVCKVCLNDISELTIRDIIRHVKAHLLDGLNWALVADYFHLVSSE